LLRSLRSLAMTEGKGSLRPFGARNDTSGPENNLIIALIKDPPDIALAEEIARLGPDWDRVLESAVREGVFHPFYKNFSVIDKDKTAIPEIIRNRFKEMNYLHVMKGADALSRMGRLLAHIDSFNMDALVIKGPAIDSLIYDDFIRPRLDLDIVVKDENMAEFQRRFRETGYAPQKTKTDQPITEYVNSGVWSDNTGELVPVHIHRHLFNNSFIAAGGRPLIGMGKVWQETEPFKNYNNIRVLKPELNIAYISEHGLKHDFDQLAYLYEIDRLIRHYREYLDWKKVVALAREFGLGRMVYYGLYFVEEIMSGDIPEEALSVLRPDKVTMGEKMFVKDVLRRRCRRYSSYPVYLADQPGPFKKLKYVLRTIFPPGFTFGGYMKRLGRLILP
jgi:hypothetical protein